MNDIYLGIDIGSTTVKVVVLDRGRTLMMHRYLRSKGRPRQTLLQAMGELFQHFDPAQIAGVGLTGSGGEPIARLIGGCHVNELIAQTRAVGEFHPEARTVIEIGGQDSKFISVEWDEKSGKMVLVDFAMNTLCAAGTGSFLDQQAERLGISIENEFAALALKSKNPARIAGRCTVFAKSDMIHLQQKGTPLPDILAGLCLAMTRNFKSVIGKGKAFIPPILFQGGVAYNKGVTRAFETVLNLEPGQLIVPDHHPLMAALGTALIAMDRAAEGNLTSFYGLDPLENEVRISKNGQKSMPPLFGSEFRVPSSELNSRLSRSNFCSEGILRSKPILSAPVCDRRSGVADPLRARNLDPLRLKTQNPKSQTLNPEPVYLGIDVGSISTNVVLIDEQGGVIARRYLLTAGKPLEAVRCALSEIGQELGEQVEVRGVGATGSGRYLTGHFAGADVVRNEITAQARAAIALDPTVDTVFEIGGQDSKYISLDHGAVVDFTMNNACAAGTGSFLEEQADRLKINIEEDFSHLALASPSPTCLGERCTVFMGSDLVHYQQQGAGVEDLTAGLAYSIAQNYLNRVVNGRTVGRNIFFQGGVASNRSVVAAFQTLTGRKITVPPHHDVTGAIGAAILAMETLVEQRRAGSAAPTKFKGFDLSDRRYHSTVFECKACPNLCEVNKVVIEGEPPIFYGARCDRFEEAGRQGRKQPQKEMPDFFAERNELLLGDYTPPQGQDKGRLRLAMPRALIFYDLFPYWRAFFKALDVELIISEATNPKTVSLASEHAVAETCFPAKLVYGHVLDLLDKEADFMFLPSVVNRENVAPGQVENKYCPFIPAMAHLVTAHIDIEAQGYRPLKFPLHMLWDKAKKKELNFLSQQLGVSTGQITKAMAAAEAAQHNFYTTVRRRGGEALASLTDEQLAVVIVGRPYNVCDSGVCQDLPFKLRKLGALPIPMDYLPLDTVDVSERYTNMFWRSGQDILAAATIIRDDPRLQAIYLTNFNCGPDSFLIGFFRQVMGDKPFLELEIDDHTADAGIITRCEAFLESLKMREGALL